MARRPINSSSRIQSRPGPCSRCADGGSGPDIPDIMSTRPGECDASHSIDGPHKDDVSTRDATSEAARERGHASDVRTCQTSVHPGPIYSGKRLDENILWSLLWSSRSGEFIGTDRWCIELPSHAVRVASSSRNHGDARAGLGGGMWSCCCP